RHREVGDDRPDSLLACDQRVQDVAAARLGDCIEDVRRRRRAGHAAIIFLYRNMSTATESAYVDQDERQLGSTFGAAATAYAEHRPDYAQAAVRWTLEHTPGRRVLDLGAGTGKLTATLVTLGVEVIAVEPDPAMLAELCKALPTVR